VRRFGRPDRGVPSRVPGRDRMCNPERSGAGGHFASTGCPLRVRDVEEDEEEELPNLPLDYPDGTEGRCLGE